MPQWLSGDLIGIIIALVLMVGSGLATWLKQQRERSEAIRRQRERMEQVQLRTQLPRGQGEAGGVASGGATPQTLTDVAAQRREQLRQLAMQRQRQMAGQGAAPPTVRPGAAPEPTNLTMAERIARARAKEQYARRAEQMRQQAPAQDAEAARRAAAERARQEARARAQREAERAREDRARQVREQARRTEAEAKRQAEQQAAQRRREAARPAEAPRQGLSRQREALSTAAADHRVATLSPRAPRAGTTLVLGRQNIRDAILLKEILDRPLALRDPDSEKLF